LPISHSAKKIKCSNFVYEAKLPWKKRMRYRRKSKKKFGNAEFRVGKTPTIMEELNQEKC
jgi:hypothetical protein